MKHAGLWSVRFRGHPALPDLEAADWDTFWIPCLDGTGALDDVEHLLEAAPHSTIVTGVLNIWGQSPQELSNRVAELDAPRLLVGLGVGNAAGAASRGQDYGNPITSMSRYLDQLDNPADRLLLGALGPLAAEAFGRQVNDTGNAESTLKNLVFGQRQSAVGLRPAVVLEGHPLPSPQEGQSGPLPTELSQEPTFERFVTKERACRTQLC